MGEEFPTDHRRLYYPQPQGGRTCGMRVTQTTHHGSAEIHRPSGNPDFVFGSLGYKNLPRSFSRRFAWGPSWRSLNHLACCWSLWISQPQNTTSNYSRLCNALSLRIVRIYAPTPLWDSRRSLPSPTTSRRNFPGHPWRGSMMWRPRKIGWSRNPRRDP